MSNLPARARTVWRLLLGGAWASALSVVGAVATTPGVLSTGPANPVAQLAAALLDVATAITAVMHGQHVARAVSLRRIADDALAVVAAANAARAEVAKIGAAVKPPAA